MTGKPTWQTVTLEVRLINITERFLTLYLQYTSKQDQQVGLPFPADGCRLNYLDVGSCDFDTSKITYKRRLHTA